MVPSIILSPQHPQNDKWSKILGRTQILLEKLIQEGCLTINNFVMDFCHSAFCFGITSHPLMKHVSSLSLCCYEIMRSLFQRVFWQNILIKLQNTKSRLINHERLKCFGCRNDSMFVEITWGDQTNFKLTHEIEPHTI
jgi:hypothetical protein